MIPVLSLMVPKLMMRPVDTPTMIEIREMVVQLSAYKRSHTVRRSVMTRTIHPVPATSVSCIVDQRVSIDTSHRKSN